MCTTITASVQTLRDHLMSNDMLYNANVFCTNLRAACERLQYIDECVAECTIVCYLFIYVYIIYMFYRKHQQQ
jgi:hypothetical protein